MFPGKFYFNTFHRALAVGALVNQPRCGHLLGHTPPVLDSHSADSHSCQLAISGTDIPTTLSGEKEDRRTLKIATYNVDSFGNEQSGYSCKEIAKYMEEHQVDIVCLQEFAANRYFTADSIRNTFANWQYVIIPQAPDSISILQIALFSKYPVKDSKLITYPDSRNCSMWCDLDVDGQTVRVFNNHLQTTEVSQNKRRLERNWLKTN